MLFKREKFEEISSTEAKQETVELEKEKMDIERIENLELNTQDRMNLILTYLGEKPVSEVEIVYNGQKALAELEEVMSQKENLEKNLSEAGLKFKTFKKEWEDEDGFEYKVFRILIGKEEEKIEELEKATLKGDEKKKGILFGYPETAVEAFSQFWEKKELEDEFLLNEKKWWQELSKSEKEKIEKEKVLNFLNFRPSKRFWREEFEVVKKWQGIIKEKAPKLFEEMTKEKPWLLMAEEEKKEYEKKAAEEELKKIREKVEKMADALGKPVDEKIKETVTILNAFDIRTSGSCEGHFQEKGEKIKYFDGEKITEEILKEPRARAPWVDVESKLSEIENWKENEKLKDRVEKQNLFYQKRMINLLDLFYREREVPFDQRLHLKTIGIYGAFRLENQGAGIFELEKKKEKLIQYQKEMEDFTKFLKEKYPDYLFKKLEI